jgi:hypothetical protein
MILTAHLSGSQPHDVGDEIWQEPLADVIRAEAEMIASYAGAELLGTGTRDSVRERIIAEMTVALVSDGDTYQAPDKILYTLDADPDPDPDPDPALGERVDTLADMSRGSGQPVVEEVLQFENLPLDRGGSRRAIVRWSNSSQSTALVWYPDEILVSEGDLVGKTQEQIRSLHFRRDRDWLQS